MLGAAVAAPEPQVRIERPEDLRLERIATTRRSCDGAGQLVKFQEWSITKPASGGHLEGRDGAGKGGTIKRITDPLNPRICRIVALPAPPSVRNRSGISRLRLHLPLPENRAAGSKLVQRAGVSG